MDIVTDLEKNNADTFILFTGDSDFVPTIERILEKGKKVIIIGAAREVAREISTLARQKKIVIFDVKKIKEFICWLKQI